MPSPKTQTELTAEQSRNFWQGARLGDGLNPMVQPKYAEIWHATKRERDDES